MQRGGLVLCGALPTRQHVGDGESLRVVPTIGALPTRASCDTPLNAGTLQLSAAAAAIRNSRCSTAQLPAIPHILDCNDSASGRCKEHKAAIRTG
jgi:hypothetical protein